MSRSALETTEISINNGLNRYVTNLDLSDCSVGHLLTTGGALALSRHGDYGIDARGS